jgi:hypothetical protein
MMQGDNIPKLYKCVYPPELGGRTLKQDKLAVGEKFNKVGSSLEKHFRDFAEKNLALMPNANYSAARFFKQEIKGNGWARGMYWNKSYLFIPINGAKPNDWSDYYLISFFS